MQNAGIAKLRLRRFKAQARFKGKAVLRRQSRVKMQNAQVSCKMNGELGERG